MRKVKVKLRVIIISTFEKQRSLRIEPRVKVRVRVGVIARVMVE